MTTDPAVTAAAKALERYGNDRVRPRPATFLGYAEWAVTAARPIIEAEVRARIAAEIEALPYDVPVPDGLIETDYRSGYDAGNSAAARIVRGKA